MSSKNQKILVIEDHESVRLLLNQFLSKEYNVTCRADGFGGLAWLSQGNVPHLIILDMSMPKLSGLDFLNNIRSSGMFRDIPVLMVSAEEDSNIIKKCHELGIKGFVNKPFNPIELKEKINNVLLQTAVA